MSNTHHSNYVFSIDIGNTRTSLALIDMSSAECIKKDNISSNLISENVNDIFTGFTSSLKGSCDIKICSVIRDIAEEVEDLLEISPETGSISIVSHNGKLPFKIDYNPIENLGADRIADALYAAHFYPGKDVIIVDAGTAVTVDLLTKDKVFRGGVIFAGLDLQLKSLAENTSRLPKLKEEMISQFKVPNSTFDAINAGTIFSIAGGIDKSIEKIKTQFENTITIFSGGNWKTISNHINSKGNYIEDLTLLGISLFEQ